MSKPNSRRESAAATEPAEKSEPVVNSGPLHIQLIDAITKRGYGKNIDLVKCLTKSSHYNEIVNAISQKINDESSASKRETLITMYIKCLLNQEKVHSAVGDPRIIEILKPILYFPDQLSSFDTYNDVMTIVDRLLESLKSCTDDNVFDILTNPPKMYSALCLSIFTNNHSALNGRSLKFITHRLGTNVNAPNAMALAKFLLQHKIDYFDEEMKEAWKGFGESLKLIEVIKKLLEGDGPVKRAAFFLMKGIFYSLSPDSSCKLLLEVLPSIMTVMAKTEPVVRLEVTSMFCDMPSNVSPDIMSPDAQLKQVIAPICEHLNSFEGPYAEAVRNLINSRKNAENMPKIVKGLFESVSTARIATMLAMDLDFDNQDLINAAFPRPPFDRSRLSFTFEATKFILTKKNCNKQLFKAICRHMIYALTEPTIIQDLELRNVALALPDTIIPKIGLHYRSFCKIIAKKGVEIYDEEALIVLASSIHHSFPEKVEGPSYQPKDDQYFNLFIHLYEILSPDEESGLTTMADILHLYNPSGVVPPPNFIKFFDNFAPKDLTQLQKVLTKKSKHNHYIYLLLASFPVLSEKEYKKLIKNVKNISPFDSRIFIDFFINLSIRNLDFALDEIAKLAVGKKLDSTSLGQKSKEKKAQFAKASLGLITRMIGDNKLSKSQQDQMYSIIVSSLPKPEKILSIQKEAKALADVFPKLNGTVPPKELANRIIEIPLFAESIPIFVPVMQVNNNLIERIIKSWLMHLIEDPSAEENNQENISLLTQLAKDQKTLISALQFSLEYLQPNFNNLEILAYCTIAAETARNQQIPTVGEWLINYTLNIASCVISDESKIRLAIYRILIDLFQLQRNPNLEKEIGGELTTPQKLNYALDLFRKIADSLKDDLGTRFLITLTQMKPMALHHALMIRGFLQTAKPYILKGDTKDALVGLMDLLPKVNSLCVYHFEKGIMGMSLTLMEPFVQIVLDLPPKCAFRKKVLNHFLTSPIHRGIFLKFFHQLLSTLPSNSKSLPYFQLLPQIIATDESAEVSASTFGTTFSELLIWLAVLFVSKDTSRSTLKNAIEEVSDCFEELFIKTAVAKKLKISIAISDFEALSTTIAALADLLILLEIDYLKALAESCKTLLKSPDQTVILTAGFVHIHMAARFSKFVNPQAIEINSLIFEDLPSIFAASDDSNVRYFSSLLHVDPKAPQHFTKDGILIIFPSVIKCLADPSEKLRQEATKFLLHLLPYAEVALTEEQLDMFLNALRQIYDQLPFSIDLLKILDYYVKQRSLVKDFIFLGKLNAELLLKLCISSSEQVSRIAITMVQSLVANSGETSFAKAIAKNVDASSLARIGYGAISGVIPEEVTPIYLNIILEFIPQIVVGTPEGERFRSQLLALLLPLAADTKCKCFNEAITAISSLVA